MPRLRVGAALSSLGLVLAFAGCGKSAGTLGAGGSAGTPGLAGAGGYTPGASSGLEHPGTLLTPPAGGLPAELLPPGWQLHR